MAGESTGTRTGIGGFIRRRRLFVLLLAVLIVALVVLYIILARRPVNSVTLNGLVEATEITLSSKLNARVSTVFVQEGNEVRKGATVVILRQDEYRDAVRQAQSALQAARAQLAEAQAGTRPEVLAQARAAVSQSESAVAGARQALSIAEENYRESTSLRASLDAAQAAYNAAQAQLRQAQQAYRLVVQGPRSEEIAQAQAAVTSAQAQATRAQQDYSRAQTLFTRGAIPAAQLDAARASAESAQAQLAQSRSRLAELRAGSRPEEIQQARAAVSQAQAQLTGARRALVNARSQYSQRIQERQALTQARTNYQTAAAQLAQNQARLQELIAGPRPEVIARLKAGVAQAQAAYAQAVTQLSNTVIKSPINGTVVTRAVEPGELATQGTPLVTLADLREVWLRVYVDEATYGRIKLGQRADVTVDSYPGYIFRGRVSEIASQAEFTPKEIQTPEQRTKLVFGVKITISNPEGRLKPGMPADATLGLSPVSR
jgi:HlyD family secretion protein